MRLNSSGPMLRVAAKAVKYYLLALFGFTIVCLLSTILGASQVAELLMVSLGEWFWRVALLLLCFLVIAIVCESLQDW